MEPVVTIPVIVLLQLGTQKQRIMDHLLLVQPRFLLGIAFIMTERTSSLPPDV